MNNALSLIKQQQRRWAKRQGIGIDAQGYTLELAQNLYRPLSPEARQEFTAGSGQELGSEARRAKLQALHSSSALAYNTFDYWRHRDLSALTQWCGASSSLQMLQLEGRFATGLKGMPANLDVLCSGQDGYLLAIESKFTEPYAKGIKNQFRPSYFAPTPGHWAGRGFPLCEQLARQLYLYRGELVFAHLDAGQLLKHILGLSRTAEQRFTLCYLWYDMAHSEGAAHRQEILQFAEALGDEVAFHARTYQDLIRTLDHMPGASDDYRNYLRERYLGELNDKAI